MSRTVTIRQIVASDEIDRAWPLLVAHREELTTNPELMRLSPRRDMYKTLDRVGKLMSLGAFTDDDNLVGYSVNIVDKNLHYEDVAISQNDLLYLTPEYRGGRTGLQLIKATEDLARERGCHMQLWHAKPGTKFNALLPRIGYGVQDIMHSKVL